VFRRSHGSVRKRFHGASSGGADKAVKERRRAAADSLVAAAAAGQGQAHTFVGGKERSFFAQSSRSSGSSRSSRWSAGPVEPAPKKLANFQKTTALKLLRRSTVQQRRAAGQQPYAVTAPRTGGLFDYQVPPLRPTSGEAVKLLPVCHVRSPGTVLDAGPGFIILPVDNLGSSSFNADVYVVQSLAELEQSADALLATLQMLGLDRAPGPPS